MLGAELGCGRYEVLVHELGWVLSWGVGGDSTVLMHAWWYVDACILGFLGLHSAGGQGGH